MLYYVFLLLAFSDVYREVKETLKSTYRGSRLNLILIIKDVVAERLSIRRVVSLTLEGRGGN